MLKLKELPPHQELTISNNPNLLNVRYVPKLSIFAAKAMGLSVDELFVSVF